MLRWLLPALAGLVISFMPAAALEKPPKRFSQCQAIAGNLPDVTYASFERESSQPALMKAAMADETVKISYLGHSTFLLETPGGVTIATDYNGWFRPAVAPMVVTMNHAHSTHYTLTPEKDIQHVLHGWSEVAGEKAQHALTVGDTYIRNVTSDIRSFGGVEKDGNSIFIFEVAGLCIGHLGHLHQELSDGQVAEIGRLDVVMVPVDGGLTMGAVNMSRVVQRLRSSLILPMHRRGPPIENFLAMFGPDFDIAVAQEASTTVSLRTLPKKPLIYILKGV